jgi:sugar (pentulose or hexulose) kinase
MYFLSKVGGVAAQNKLWNLILAQRIGLHFSISEEAQ